MKKTSSHVQIGLLRQQKANFKKKSQLSIQAVPKKKQNKIKKKMDLVRSLSVLRSRGPASCWQERCLSLYSCTLPRCIPIHCTAPYFCKGICIVFTNAMVRVKIIKIIIIIMVVMSLLVLLFSPPSAFRSIALHRTLARYFFFHIFLGLMTFQGTDLKILYGT